MSDLFPETGDDDLVDMDDEDFPGDDDDDRELDDDSDDDEPGFGE